MWLDTLQPHHYEKLFEIHKKSEAIVAQDFVTFTSIMQRREGFVIVDKTGKLIGCISLSDYVPGSDAVIHCFVDPDHHGKWAFRKGYKQVFDYAFNMLNLPRLSGFCIVGLTDKAGRFLEALGFKLEGTIRRKVKDPKTGTFHAVNIYGMLKEERRW